MFYCQTSKQGKINSSSHRGELQMGEYMEKNFRTSVFTILFLTCFSAHSFGFDQAAREFYQQHPIKKLLTVGHCTGCDLSGVNLKGADLIGANLLVAKLFRANLTEANLAGARLRGAKLIGATMRGANLQGAKLDWADLSGADLTGAHLEWANIKGAIFCMTKTPWGEDNSGCKYKKGAKK